MNSVREQCPKSDSGTVLSQKLAKCTMCTATTQPARIGSAQAARSWPCRGRIWSCCGWDPRLCHRPSSRVAARKRAPLCAVPHAPAPCRRRPSASLRRVTRHSPAGQAPHVIIQYSVLQYNFFLQPSQPSIPLRHDTVDLL